ncbi:prepilin peptidase [Pseudogulbenkiania sp. MAI-1]|uniref:A24 family peptidase n=1 Tax=Pseudogulbenkiania sp. MAI-1 TaxID=990370 RepID=UPI00045EB813|nr:A24 family peptidase [Pseudogulbenkiania sp. MAI-1]
MFNILLGARLGLLAGFLLAAVFTDTATRKIPNKLVAAGVITGLLCQALLPDGDGLIAALKGMVLGFALFFPLYMLRVMGAGDVKLMAMVGTFTGHQDIIGIVLSTLLAGGILSLLFALRLRAVRQLLANLRSIALLAMAKASKETLATSGSTISSVGTLPYALAIAIGTAGYFIWQIS